VRICWNWLKKYWFSIFWAFVPFDAWVGAKTNWCMLCTIVRCTNPPTRKFPFIQLSRLFFQNTVYDPRRSTTPKKLKKKFLLTDSDAALHEDSEYYLGCIIWTSFHRAISSFLKNKKFFFEIWQKQRKVFCMFCSEDGSKSQTFLVNITFLNDKIMQSKQKNTYWLQ